MLHLKLFETILFHHMLHDSEALNKLSLKYKFFPHTDQSMGFCEQIKNLFGFFDKHTKLTLWILSDNRICIYLYTNVRVFL